MLNWLVFDRDFNPMISQSGFQQIPTTAKETGDNVDHQQLARETPLLIKQTGYVYNYISNYTETSVEVFFDDFKVEHMESPASTGKKERDERTQIRQIKR